MYMIEIRLIYRYCIHNSYTKSDTKNPVTNYSCVLPSLKEIMHLVASIRQSVRQSVRPLPLSWLNCSMTVVGQMVWLGEW